MPAVIARSILPMSGLSSSRQASDSAPPERSSSATSAPRSRWASTSDLSIARSGERSGRISSRQMREGSPPRRITIGQVVRIEDSTSSTARGSMLTNRTSPSGISGRPTSSAAARARASKEKSASWASAAADQLGAAQLDRAQHAAHQRLAAVGLAAGEVDDRLEVRRHLAVGEELGEPVGARAVEQRVGRDRQALLVVEPDGEEAGALGVRDRAQEVLQALLPAGARELQALDRDVAVDRLGRVVLELVEHGRTVRQQSHAVSGLAALPYRVHLGQHRRERSAP